MTIAVLGAGAFGTALAVTLARDGGAIILWCRNPDHAAKMRSEGSNARRLPGIELPKNIAITAEIGDVRGADFVLLSVPMQQLEPLLLTHRDILNGKALIGCAKGMELSTGRGTTALIRASCPDSVPAILTGPSFAADIARGLPTALTLACSDETVGSKLQAALSTPVLRLYLSTDTTGAELGGALKNVIAIAAGVAIGAGLGDSARAAIMTRGFAEMNRFAAEMGARAETLAGLSGFGDLVLTCTSPQSRNYRYGHALGLGEPTDPEMTVEGVATARAVAALARKRGLDLPVTGMVAAMVENQISVPEAIRTLLSRPLKKE